MGPMHVLMSNCQTKYHSMMKIRKLKKRDSDILIRPKQKNHELLILTTYNRNRNI